MIVTKERLNDLLYKYSIEEAEELGLTVRDQILIEQLKALNTIKQGVTFLVVVTILGIVITVLASCGF